MDVLVKNICCMLRGKKVLGFSQERFKIFREAKDVYVLKSLMEDRDIKTTTFFLFVKLVNLSNSHMGEKVKKPHITYAEKTNT